MTDLGTHLARIQRELDTLKRASKLTSASLDDTNLEVRDGSGSLRALVGQQADGTTAMNIVNGGPPPAPSTPSAAPAIGGLAVTWDGAFAGGAIIPLDWSRVEVHASITNGFTPSATTLQATIETPQGSTVYLPSAVPLYVVLLARNTSGAASPATTQVGPYAPRAVVAGDVADGSITETKVANDAISTPKIKANAVDTAQLNALAITTAKLAAGSVDATALSATAITGKTITGGTVTGATVTGGVVQTAASGRRVALTTAAPDPADDTPGGTVPALELFSGSGIENTPGLVVADVDTGSPAFPYSALHSPSLKNDPDYAFPITAYLRLIGPQLNVRGGSMEMRANDALGNPDNLMGDVRIYGYTASSVTGVSHLEMRCENGASAPGGNTFSSGAQSSVELDGAQVSLKTATATASGTLVLTPAGVAISGDVVQGGIDRGRGIVGRASIAANTATTTTTETVAMTTGSINFLAGRAYRVTVKGLAQSSVAADRVQVHVRKTNAAGAVYLDSMSALVIPAANTNVAFYLGNEIGNFTGATITAVLVMTYVRQTGSTGNVRIAADTTHSAYLEVEDIGLATAFANATAMA